MAGFASSKGIHFQQAQHRLSSCVHTGRSEHRPGRALLVASLPSTRRLASAVDGRSQCTGCHPMATSVLMPTKFPPSSISGPPESGRAGAGHGLCFAVRGPRAGEPNRTAEENEALRLGRDAPCPNWRAAVVPIPKSVNAPRGRAGSRRLVQRRARRTPT